MTLVLPVGHRRQHSNWDCGITCLQMLLDYYRLDLSAFARLLQAYECNQSTWTIDLLHLLHRSGVRAVLHTITIGCSEAYNDVPYYEDLIGNDRQRVNQLFASEASHVKLGSLDWSTLKAHLLEHRTPCIVLVDADKLDCCTCRKTMFARIVDKLLPMVTSSYQGHYVLLTGYAESNGLEFIRYVDPGKTDGLCTTTRDNFDLARRAFGTDEDVILCYEASRP